MTKYNIIIITIVLVYKSNLLNIFIFFSKVGSILEYDLVVWNPRQSCSVALSQLVLLLILISYVYSIITLANK